MAGDADNPEITPQVMHLVDLLKRAREGKIRIPVFQRDFVWRRQDIIDLFDSVTRQYPIGTLFFLGSDHTASSRLNIGPLRLPEVSGEKWLVLDGQQRLTTLVGVLLADDPDWSSSGDDDPGRWKLYYDAENRTFAHASSEQIPTSYLPVTALLDTVKLFTQLQEKIRVSGEDRKEQVVSWISKAQEAARSIQSYRIPTIEIKTRSLSIAVESFSRLNKKGRTIGQDEMFSALTYEEKASGSFHLASHIDKLQLQMIRARFGEVERTTLLRAVLTAAGLDMYRTDWTTLGDELKQQIPGKLPNAIKEAERGLKQARRFLAELGVLNSRMLPYSMQIVALSAFFGRCDRPTDQQLALLRRWFWVSSFSGWFGTNNPTSVRKLVEEFRDRVAKDGAPVGLQNLDLDEPALPTPLRFDLRSARVRTLLCVLFARGPRLVDGREFPLSDAAALLLEAGPEAMAVLCATVKDEDLRKSPANRILDVSQATAIGQAKNWLLGLDERVRDAILDSHAIPASSFSLLSSNDNIGFLRARFEYIGEIERNFMKQERVSLPKSLAPSASPIDNDDVPAFDELEI